MFFVSVQILAIIGSVDFVAEYLQHTISPKNSSHKTLNLDTLSKNTFNLTGEFLHEICDPKLESIGDINACVVLKSEMWLAYYNGLTKLKIGYY